MRNWSTRFIAFPVLVSSLFLTKPIVLGQESEPKQSSPTKEIDLGDPSASTIVQSLYIGEPESIPSQSEKLMANWLGAWLKSPARFRTEVAVHFASDATESERGNVIATICFEKADGFENSGHATQASDRSETAESALGTHLTVKPLVFSTGFEKFVEEVIACGHRICLGNKCYDVKDQVVAGDDCSTSEAPESEDEEEIMVVPAAPPAPPPMYFTRDEPHKNGQEILLDDSVLKELEITGAAKVVMNLLVDNAKLSSRLELTETLMLERQAAMEQIYALAEKNARLQTQLAVNEAKQYAAEQLAASLIDRTEMAMRMVALRTDNSHEEPNCGESSLTLKNIQEDLSNIRKQIGLMKRQAPVPFAPSSVGLPRVQPYVPMQNYCPPVETSEPAIASEPTSTSKY
ncbi:hypothetical protein SH449x_001418 [Pirellulaceae bacterium SH449]